MKLVVPTIALDLSLLERLLESIDYRVSITIINNGDNEKSIAHLLSPDAGVLYSKNNLGVAASWNLIPHQWTWSSDKAWIFVNDDIQFEPGALGEFCRKVDELADKESFIMWDETDYFACFAWTRVGVERFGLFDENYFPGYEEDADMKMRWAVEGYRPPNVFGKHCPMKHGKPQCGGPRYNKMIQDGASIRLDYFIRKWGTLDFRQPLFKHPFNDPTKSLKDWEIEPWIRKKLQATWDEFISQPNPSIYT